MRVATHLKTLLHLLILSVILISTPADAQNIFARTISLEATMQPFEKILELISRKGNFYFSYNSSIINSDSLVTINVYNKPVKQVLEMLFNNNYEYKESGNYIIIRRAPMRLVLITNKAITEDKFYIIRGYVIDDRTGEKISDASIYEKQQLTTTLTNEKGFFKLRLKSRYTTAAITVSEESYDDTTVIIQPKYNQQLTITIVPVETSQEITTISPYPLNSPMPDTLKLNITNDSSSYTYTYKKVDSFEIEKTALGKFFLSSAQKIQSLNLSRFFAERLYQVSLTPGLSTHGKLSAQVVNNFSLNSLGGYTAGVNGFELGGFFNINKKSMRYAQIGGIFNIVGGDVTGLQIAGIHNLVLQDVEAVQLAGINNTTRGNFNGVQISGIYNHAGGAAKGLQLAGIGNFTGRTMKGVQISGIANINNKGINGVQTAGILNYAKKLRGVQIGLINISGVSEGYSIGLINIVMKGYHKLNFSTNEVMNINAAFKTGNSKFYNILSGGINTKQNEKLYSFGYGLGTDIGLGKYFSINPEITSQYLYLGNWDHLNLLNRFNLNFNIKFNRLISLSGGPAFNVYYSDQTSAVNGYKYTIPSSKSHLFDLGNSHLKSWIGWNIGISFF